MSVRMLKRISVFQVGCTMLAIAGCQGEKTESFYEECFVGASQEGDFIGTPECILKFKNEKIEGYWVVGLEYSLFYLSREDLENGGEDRAFSLQFLDTPNREIRRILVSPKIRAYHVSFEGSKSELSGIYANGFLELHGGVVVKDNFSIKGELSDISVNYGDSG